MTKPQALALWRAFLCLVLIAVGLMLNACTIVKYTSPERTLTLIDLHPTQNALSLEGMIEDASLSVNREQGGAEGLVEEVGNVVSPNPLD